MRLASVAIAIVVGLATASSAVADPSPHQDPTRQIAYKYAVCVVKRRADTASKAVLLNVDQLTLATRYHVLVEPDCLRGGRLAFPGNFLIYELADALVGRELAASPVPDLSTVAPLEPSSMPPFDDLKKKFGYDAALQATYDAVIFGRLDKFGECVVRNNPAAAKALLMTEPQSPEELSGFDALQPALSQCAPEGKTMELSKIQVRGTIAFNYYRLAQAALHVPVR